MVGLTNDLMEQYKLACEMADRVSARRATANNYLFTIHAALLAVMASGDLDGTLIATAGLILTLAWSLLLRSYRDLNKAKFAVILAMEEHLPWKVYGDEWDSLKKDPVPGWRGRYAEFNTIERLIPAVFALVYGALLVQEVLS